MNDQQQRDDALNLSESFIVQAPAGSGKTELIAQRYLKLLGSAEQPENILVMTFTNRAVDELKHRIISSLNQAINEPPLEKYKRTTYDLASKVLNQSVKRGWDLINHPSRLKIITIDSLSNLIVSRFPSLEQLVPPRTMVDSFEYDTIYRRAAEETLLLIEDDEYQKTISSVLLYLDNDVDRFYRLVEQMLKKREQWLPKIYAEGALDISYIEDFSCELIAEHLNSLRAKADTILSPNFFSLLKQSKRDDVSKIIKLPGKEVDDLGKWQIISELLITKSKSNWRKSVDVKMGFPPELREEKIRFKEILEDLKSQFEFKELLINLDYLPSSSLPSQIKNSISDIIQVLKLSVAKLNIIFDQEKLQDFSEVNIQAINALDSRDEISDIALMIEKRNPGVSIVSGGIFADIEEGFRDIFLAMAISIILVYLVMVGSLGSLRNPFVILFSLPLAAIGALVGLAVTGSALGLPSMMGLLLLIGLVVTNAIVLISFVQQLQDQGMTVRESLIEGGLVRLRPILMTAVTTGAALIPLAVFVGDEGGGIIGADLAIVVIGGLASSTFLTLLVIPIIYEFMHETMPKFLRLRR